MNALCDPAKFFAWSCYFNCEAKNNKGSKTTKAVFVS